MCGVIALVGARDAADRVAAMSDTLNHRGPDARGSWTDPNAQITLGHTRLSIIDRSTSGSQPMLSADGRYVLVFNGEIYNYVELRTELRDYPFRSSSDTEVLLAAWQRWGATCLDRLIGMFAFVIWDRVQQEVTAVRDRFGVKPLMYAVRPDGALVIASEVRALHTAGIAPVADDVTWATYLVTGHSDHTPESFWQRVLRIPPGHLLTSRVGSEPKVRAWYDLVANTAELDARSADEVKQEYRALLHDSVRLRFRSDVPIGINLSGGLDSSLLLALVPGAAAAGREITAYSYVTGDQQYDELPWMEHMRHHTGHTLHLSTLSPDEVPALAEDIASYVQEPYGGVPTLAYAKLFRVARANGTIVLLDGQGMDEQWAGYDYYQSAPANGAAARLQGSVDPVTRPECLSVGFAALAREFDPPQPYPDRLRNLQWQDFRYFKLLRALRFSDRVSMAASTELREPFLDHRLVELALRQPEDRKIRGSSNKWLMREVAESLVPDSVRLVPKRPVQTPQREWLRGPLRDWATAQIETVLNTHADWFDPTAMRSAWARFVAGHGDNSFWVWQWLSVAWIDASVS